ncbi:MAG TPA: hypothetical protein VKH64_12075 [Candidatus Binatia bacterium]|nr:hypothetical protein [Candidatus Binatia bacterium]
MQLRSHPLMNYRGVRNWPPVWSRLRGAGDRHPKGEVGILREVRWPAITVPPANKLFIVMEFDNTVYMGCLLFEDPAFCAHVEMLLRAHCGSSIEHIGGLDVSHTL